MGAAHLCQRQQQSRGRCLTVRTCTLAKSGAAAPESLAQRFTTPASLQRRLCQLLPAAAHTPPSNLSANSFANPDSSYACAQGIANSTVAGRRRRALLQAHTDNVTVYYDIGSVPDSGIKSLPATLNSTATMSALRALLKQNGACGLGPLLVPHRKKLTIPPAAHGGPQCDGDEQNH